MTYLNAFIFCGIICLIGQIILDNTRLTPGHVTSIFVCIGAFLDSFGLYDKFIIWAGGGASVPITSFGHLLIHGALTEFNEAGIMGLFMGKKTTSSPLPPPKSFLTLPEARCRIIR